MKQSYMPLVLGLILSFFINNAYSADCPSGYEKNPKIDSSTFMAPINGRCSVGGYSLVEIDDDFLSISTGFILGAAVTLCDNGYLENGTCKSFDQGNCKSGTYNSHVDTSTFMAPVSDRCTVGGYSLTDIDDNLFPAYNGILMGNPVTLCDNGYLSDGTCVSYAQGACPSGYLDLELNDNTVTRLNNGVCASGYGRYKMESICGADTTSNLCAIMCDGGLQYTDVGTCATICSAGATQLKYKTSTGEIRSYPLYSEKQSTPSLNVNVGDGGDVCYMNLLTGDDVNAPGALHIKYNNKTYHGVN